MKLTGLSLALALALFSGQAVFAATPPQVESRQSSGTGNDVETIYNSWVNAWRPVFTSLYGANGFQIKKVGSLADQIIGGQIFTNARIPGTVTPTFEGTPVYSQSFLYMGFTQLAGYNVPKPVPGPEAGVGLGALALGGFALWRRRQAVRSEA